MRKQRREDETAPDDFTALHRPPQGKLSSFHRGLLGQCLCDVSESVLRKTFEGGENGALYEWPLESIQQFLGNLQLLFDVFLEQNGRGKICGRIKGICDTLVRNEHCLVEQIISLCDFKNKYVNCVSARVLSSFFIAANQQMNKEWLGSVVWFLTTENKDYVKVNFALEVVKWVVEWKDMEAEDFDEGDLQAAGSSSQTTQDFICANTVETEFYDTSLIKKSLINSLQSIWQDLIMRIFYLISHNDNAPLHETCILTFLSLWERTISIKANLSVIDTKPFYAHLETFVTLLHNTSPAPIIWKQLLSLFNEVLCYGSTLALQGLLPDNICRVAHLVVRYVKDFRFLDSLPHRRSDKILLQKMILLVLKSVAVTIKETRSDSSDSSDSSDDTDFNHDMQLIERSIRDVLKKVDVFIKNSVDFHPETPFSKVLVHLFSDQPVYMFEAMLCTLDITIGISYHNAVYPDLLEMLNPVHSFIEFLKIISHDSKVLLHYLVDNETCFLLYLLRFLKYVRKNWQKFARSCYENSGARTNDLHNTMTLLIRLKMDINNAVAKGEIKYKIGPVLEELESCQSLYEGNEYS